VVRRDTVDVPGFLARICQSILHGSGRGPVAPTPSRMRTRILPWRHSPIDLYEHREWIEDAKSPAARPS
jgi:hypothetical protein